MKRPFRPKKRSREKDSNISSYQNLINLGKEMTASLDGKYSGSMVSGALPSGRGESVAMLPHTDSKSGLRAIE